MIQTSADASRETRRATKEMAAERDAAKQFARLQRRLFESGGDAVVAADLETFAQTCLQKNRAPRVAARANELLVLTRALHSER